MIAAPDAISIASWAVSLETAKFWVSVLGFLGAIAGLFFTGLQFRRSERWRRSEFVAKEIKEFEAVPQVRNVFQMIDWSSRRINLTLDAQLPKEKWPLIERPDLWRALLPHPIKGRVGSWADRSLHRDPAANISGFSDREVAIRDSFDVFLDRLGRFGTFANTGLVPGGDFKPYLQYWVDDLATPQGNADGAAWRCVLMVYIQYYRFDGVQELFKDFGYDIRPGGACFLKLQAAMADQELGKALLEQVQSDEATYLASVRSDDDPEVAVFPSLPPVPSV